MKDDGLFTIGRLARRTGLSARTIRFYSDAGLVPESKRSTGGYRLYDVTALARLELVRTLPGPRVDRFWALLSVINGWPPAQDASPGNAWVIEALSS